MDYPEEATFYIRLSLMQPRAGMRDDVVKLHEELVAWLPGQPGFVRGYLIIDGDPEGRVGHLNVYHTGAAAEAIANTNHVLSLRSRLLLLIEEDSHAEHSYISIDPLLIRAPRS